MQLMTMHCTRYQELEEALTLAEQHLQQHEKEGAVEDLQQQIHILQSDLRQTSARADQLHADLQTAGAARQKATDELAASVKQQEILQVGWLP